MFPALFGIIWVRNTRDVPPVSSRLETYRILVAGDEEMGFSICTKLTDRKIVDPKTVAKKVLTDEWPRDEWTKLVTLSLDGAIVTIELDIELHGPWVWELYNVMQPRDYFRRFAGVVLAANPKRSDSFWNIPSFVESLDTHLGHRIPLLVVSDETPEMTKKEKKSVEDMAGQLSIPAVFVNLKTGENLESVFKRLATAAYQSDRS